MVWFSFELALLLQRDFEENRNAELVETQRLEEQERRRREEKVDCPDSCWEPARYTCLLIVWVSEEKHEWDFTFQLLLAAS